MPKNLSFADPSSAIERFYTTIHVRMAAHEAGGADVRPTILEFKDALRRFSIQPDGLALDAGCGGTAAVAAACASHGFHRVHAIDINQESLRHARTLVNGGDHDVHVSCGSVLALPFADGAFDFAACLGVAHHTPDPEQAIAELARVLRPTGKLYLSLYCFAGSFFDLAVQVLRWVGARIPFGTVHRISGRSRVMNNFVLDHMYVPTLWLFRAEEVRALLARHHLVTLAEWTSQMDPWADCGWMGRRISGDGLMRVWLCEKQ